MKKIVVGIAIVINKKILILKRKTDDFMGGYWEIPGGNLDNNETLEVAARRELLEETGLEAGLLKITDIRFEYKTKKNVVEQINLLAEIKQSDIEKISLSEHEQFAWVSINDLDLYKFSKEMRSCIEKLLNIT